MDIRNTKCIEHTKIYIRQHESISTQWENSIKLKKYLVNSSSKNLLWLMSTWRNAHKKGKISSVGENLKEIHACAYTVCGKAQMDSITVKTVLQLYNS